MKHFVCSLLFPSFPKLLAFTAAAFILLPATLVQALELPPEVLLWPKGAPGSEARANEPEKALTTNGPTATYFNLGNVHRPTITPFLPKAAKAGGNVPAIIIAPGGGHRMLCLGHEGYALGQWLSDHGVAAFVLKYRLAREEGSTYTIQEHAMADMRRSIRLIRSRASEWNVDPKKLGVMGFSAGGELAAFAAMEFDSGKKDSDDAVEREGSRPDFQVLIYPGTSGLFSARKDMPPIFIACGYKDRPDISTGMAQLYLKYKEAGVPAELHIYSASGHGFGYVDTDKAKATAAGRWPERLMEWMSDMGISK
ncbi:MAG TPA: alpha/beta hydrolase [Roseimicrobium sp.]|nr:alpha/beta hydrolase [Roseimicrobium sp.]